MNAIKNLFALKSKKEQEENKESKLQESEKKIKLTYYESGYGDSKGASGNERVLETCLSNIYEEFKSRCRKDDIEQQHLMKPYLEEQGKQETELNKRTTIKQIKEKDLAELNDQIKQIDSDIPEVKTNPEKFGIDADKKPLAQFYIGLIILLPITLYLIVFYMSASYSGFFKEFTDDELIGHLFAADAFSKSLSEGWLPTTFICTIPFAFMGLGYLIHMFQKQGKAAYVKIAALFVVTFLFDAILAYMIDQKLYDFNKTLEDPPFDLSIAITSAEFWGIIFAGFVVYVIWGLVFDFIMKEYENMDKIKLFIKSLKEKKQRLEDEYARLRKDINDIESEITEIKGKLKELSSHLNGFVFPNRKYLLYFSEYTKGWYMAISKEIALPTKEKNQLIERCQDMACGHLDKHNLQNENHENKIYLADT